MNTMTTPLPRGTREPFPAPTVDGTRDGGLGYDDLKDRNAYTYVEVGPLLDANAGDSVEVLWAGVGVKQYTVTQLDLDNGRFPIPVVNAQIADIGDGDQAVTYVVTYAPGGGTQDSLPRTVTVKRSVPGGLDPHPETPINENLTAATISPNPVPDSATEVIVSVPLWPDAALGDVMGISWDGTLLQAPPLSATPFPDPFVFVLTAAQVLEAGVGPEVPVSWSVHDVVNNWSGWATYTTVDVQLEDPGLFTAPRIGDLIASWTQIDLATLGNADVMVFTPVYTGAVAGDAVIVHAEGTTLGDETVIYQTPAKTMEGAGFGLEFVLPNATVRALANSIVRIWYTVGAEAKPSHSIRLPVVGAAQGDLPAPVVAEAVDTDGDGQTDRLDPDTASPAHITIDYPTMALYDTVTLVLEGTAGDGSPVRYQADRQVGTVAALTLTVSQSEILKFLDGEMDVYYKVAPFTRRNRTFIRALQEQTSAHLALRVGKAGAEEPLPAPAVSANGSAIEEGGFLDPASEECMSLAGYPDIAKNDEITYSWVGTMSTRTQTYKVADPSKPPADYIDRDFIERNTGGEVKAGYSVRRLSADPPVQSQVLTFRIQIASTVDFGADHLLDLENYCVAEGRPPRSPPDHATYTRVATGGQPPYTYTSTNPDIATVDAGGKVSACRNGTAQLIATDANGAKGTHAVTITGARVFRHITSSSHLDSDGKATYKGVQSICNEGGWLFPSLRETKLLWSQYSTEGKVASVLGWAADSSAALYWTADGYSGAKAWSYDLNGPSRDGNGKDDLRSTPCFVVVRV